MGLREPGCLFSRRFPAGARPPGRPPRRRRPRARRSAIVRDAVTSAAAGAAPERRCEILDTRRPALPHRAAGTPPRGIRARRSASSEGSVAATTAPTSDSPVSPGALRAQFAHQVGETAAQRRAPPALRPGSRRRRGSTCARARTRPRPLRARPPRSAPARRGRGAGSRSRRPRPGPSTVPHGVSVAPSSACAYAAAVCGTSPRLPSATTSRPAARACAATSPSALQPGEPSRSKQASWSFTPTQAAPAASTSARQWPRHALAASSAGGVSGGLRAGGRQQVARDRDRGRAAAGSRRSRTRCATRSPNIIGAARPRPEVAPPAIAGEAAAANLSSRP